MDSITIPTAPTHERPWYLEHEIQISTTTWAVVVLRQGWEGEERAILCKAPTLEQARADALRCATLHNDEENLLEGLNMETATWICPICDRERSVSEGCCSVMDGKRTPWGEEEGQG